MKKQSKIKCGLSQLVLTICCQLVLSACSNSSLPASNDSIKATADKVWAYSLTHPDGFTLNVRTMTEPSEGIAVSYAETQDSHSRNQLDKVVSHALRHDGYVGGWLNREDGLYYFDSSKLFPEISPPSNNALPET